MTLSETHLHTQIEPRGGDFAVQKLNRLHADLVSTARTSARDEMGATVAHQLNEPLTALLIYLHEIDYRSAAASGAAESPTSVRQTVGMAMKEAERACDILEKVCQGGKDATDVNSDVLARSSAQNSANARRPTLTLFADRHLLTPREREVLAEIAGGATNKQGSHRLGISTRTFEVHRSHIMQKTGAKNAADLVRSLLTAA